MKNCNLLYLNINIIISLLVKKKYKLTFTGLNIVDILYIGKMLTSIFIIFYLLLIAENILYFTIFNNSAK